MINTTGNQGNCKLMNPASLSSQTNEKTKRITARNGNLLLYAVLWALCRFSLAILLLSNPCLKYYKDYGEQAHYSFYS